MKSFNTYINEKLKITKNMLNKQTITPQTIEELVEAIKNEKIIEELEKFYTEELNQIDEMKYETQDINNNKNKIRAYSETSTEYTHKFDFNDEYDVMIISSSMGLTDTY